MVGSHIAQSGGKTAECFALPKRLATSKQQREKYLLYQIIARLCLINLLLASSASFASEYRIGLCIFGCPVGAISASEIIIRPIYALAYNSEYKSADWVVYKVTANSIGIASSLSRAPIPDNFISDTLDVGDFQDLEGTGLIRSQYVPVVNFAGTPYWNDTNFVTNAVARSSNLNQGAWYGLEWAIRNLVSREQAVFIVTGPIYEATPSIAQLRTAKPHRVPDAFFKIVITESGQASAFLLRQDVPVHVHHCDLRVSIAELEAVTALDFFPEAGARQFASLDSGLGCP
ncbi:MAG: DNA/RNA non-specific endonuclease [Gammaproteobacteria bacterium]|nr:DNA/RNA non-specific endonuclease [Gammaproteobacteria bacterium]